MIRQHKKMLILTSVITLLPIVIGLILWRQLPSSVATHFGVDNQPDGYCSKAFAVFGLPVIMLLFHLICIVATNIDPKRKNISKNKLEKEANLQSTQLHSYCNNKVKRIDLETIAKICCVFECKVEDIMEYVR